MGLYTVRCIKCDNRFTWFSGNSIQICSDCKENDEKEQALKKEGAHEEQGEA